ncbi:MAG: hypothetical protein K0R92_150 [Lachnospiraceae bacterium]|nr:hypothetical protein [Lachnospiraceae bacterium]
MISLKILEIKNFMSHLLVHNVFDNYLMSELDITTFTSFHISGKLNHEYYSSDEAEMLNGRRFSLWSEIKPFAFSLLKGNKLPSSIKIVFALAPENIDKLLTKYSVPFKSEEVSGLFLNIRYENGNLYLISGTSVQTFTLDKSLEHAWDSYVKTFLKHYEIAYEEQ